MSKVIVPEQEAISLLGKDLEKDLRLQTNISYDNIRRNRVLTINRGQIGIRDNESGEMVYGDMIYHHLYFLPDESSLKFQIGHGGFEVSLKKENYGLSGIVAYDPLGQKHTLSEKSENRYAALLGSRTMNIEDLLETVGAVINDSMEFNPEGSSLEQSEEAMKALSASTYTPTGEEVMKGICTDAGNMIRELIRNLQLDPRYKFFEVSTRIGEISHDNTIVFDTVLGNWAVINSKSPRIPHNLVSSTQLGQMGNAYNRG